MSTNTKQDVWCVRVYEERLKTVVWSTLHKDHAAYLLFALCRRAPSSETRSSETPMKGLFNPVLQIFFPFFFLLITERVVWEVTSKQSFLWFCVWRVSVRPAILRPVFAPLTRKNTLLYTLTYTHKLSRSPFQNHLCFSSLPVCWPHRNSFLKGCQESSLITRIG